MIVVDVHDKDCSTRDKFMECLGRYSPINITLEKLIYAFLDCLTSSDSNTIEDMGYEITQLEELVLHDRVGGNFNLQLLHMKKELLTMRNYYEQLIDIGDALEDNENEILTTIICATFQTSQKKQSACVMILTC